MRAVVLLAFAGLAGCLAPAPPAELVVVNARVFTADPEQPRAEAVAVRDGVFTAVGATDTVASLAGERTRVIDAGGRLLVPGLTDAHAHLGVYESVCDQLPPVNLPFPGPTPEELLAAVAAAPGDGWLCATAGPIAIEEDRNWRDALDEAAPARPVVVATSWGHPTLLNSLMASGPSLDQTLATLAAVKTPLTWSVYGWGYPPEPLDRIWDDVAAPRRRTTCGSRA